MLSGVLRPRRACALSLSISVALGGWGCGGLPPVADDRDTSYSTIDDGADGEIPEPASAFQLAAQQLAEDAYAFIVEAESDESAAAYDFLWDFGDGNTADGGRRREHRYESPGDYVVRAAARRAAGPVAFVLETAVSVAPVGRPGPAISAGEDRDAESNEKVCLQVEGLETVGPDAPVIWTQTIGPSVLLQDGAGEGETCFVAPAVTSATVLGFAVTVETAERTLTDEVRVTVKPAIRTAGQIEAFAGPNQSVMAGDVVTLHGEAAGDGAEAARFSWTQVQGPAAELDNPDSAITPFVAPDVIVEMTLVFRLRVQSGSSVAVDEVAVVVTPAGDDDVATNGLDTGFGGGGGSVDEDLCPEDPDKLAPGVCGCGVPDDDSDLDGAPDCLDECPLDENKTAEGLCGCGEPELDSDDDGQVDCGQPCPGNPDQDGDGALDCFDLCPNDPAKTSPGLCGCGVADDDSDGDTTADCLDACPGSDDRIDVDADGTPDGCDPHLLRVSVTALSFAAADTTLSFEVWNAGTAPLSYTVAADAAWLSVSPTSGSSAGEHDRIDVTVDRTGLAPGQHGATIVVQRTTGALLTIAVTLSVAAAEPMTTASRTTGVAPLSVFFDALPASSGVVQPADGDYPTQHYVWNFGDETAGTWSTTGRSRNEAVGYVAAHVYEKPGTYTATLTVTTPAGQKHTYSQTITVTDPATAPGWMTYYVAANGDDNATGLSPSTPLKSFAKAMSKATARTRILFRRGDTFAVSAGKSLAAGPGIIGAYGDPQAPVPVLNAGTLPFVFRLQSADWRLMDLKLTGSGADSTAVDCGSAVCTQLLALRLKISGFYMGILNTYFPTPIRHDHNFIVECELSGQANKAVFLGGTRNAVLGNHMHDTASHILRIWHAVKAVVSENKLLDPLDAGGAVIKLHNATEVKDLPDGRHIIISGNVIRGHTWAVTIGTQGAWANETVRDVVVERNLFLAGPNSRIACRVSAQNVFMRNNAGNLTGGTDPSHLFSVTRWGAEPPPTGARIFNNLVYRGDNRTAQLVEASLADTLVYNNLAYAPSGTAILGGSGPNFLDNLVGNPQWVNPAAHDFRLQPGSPAIDRGRAVPLVEDVRGVTRPVDGDGDGTAKIDLGPEEYVP